MNNREWLNTLNYEEQKKVIENKVEEIIDIKHSGHTNYFKVIDVFLEWYEGIHETTADEDFKKIGFIPSMAGVSTGVWYRRENRDYVAVYTCGISFKGNFEDEEINQIRPIADKKRKEMGWGNEQYR